MQTGVRAMAARLMTRGASAAAAAAGASAGGALVARHVVGGGSLRSSASTSTSTSTSWRGGLANGGADGVAAARGFAHASTPSYGHGHSHGGDAADDEKITVTFIEKDGTETVVQAPVGMSMLEVAHRNDIELEGACEGSLACSTCHVIIQDQAVYDSLPEPDDDENDMLDLAFGLTETSRLGCQVIAAKELDGMVLSLPKATRNFAVDGFVPKPH